MNSSCGKSFCVIREMSCTSSISITLSTYYQSFSLLLTICWYLCNSLFCLFWDLIRYKGVIALIGCLKLLQLISASQSVCACVLVVQMLECAFRYHWNQIYFINNSLINMELFCALGVVCTWTTLLDIHIIFPLLTVKTNDSYSCYLSTKRPSHHIS